MEHMVLIQVMFLPEDMPRICAGTSPEDLLILICTSRRTTISKVLIEVDNSSVMKIFISMEVILHYT